MVDIFISYAREDRAKAESLAAVLRGRGWEAWWDFRLRAGEIWDEIIERRLAAAKCVVVLWSSTSVTRPYVRAEASDGRERGILVPALLERVRSPLAFRLVQAEDLTDWSGDPDHSGLLRLLDAISGHVQRPPHPGPRPPAGEGDAHRDPHPPADAGPSLSRERERVGVRAFRDLEVFRDGDAPWCPEMVVIPAGSFLMGSPPDEAERSADESPQHRVTIPSWFAIGQYAVTFAEYDHFCEVMKREKPADQGWGRGRQPVINVNWRDAKAYCEWLSQDIGQPYRLPSEAEWEYTCRAGTTTPFSFGGTISADKVNYDGNYTYANGAKGTYRQRTVAVGSLPANPWGLYEMHGNVWEWVEDIWHADYSGALDEGSAWTAGEGTNSSSRRVVRGGSWDLLPWVCRSAYRYWFDPDFRDYYLGFRVARTLS